MSATLEDRSTHDQVSITELHTHEDNEEVNEEEEHLLTDLVLVVWWLLHLMQLKEPNLSRSSNLL